MTVEPNFPRGPIAAEEGLHGAFAAPIAVGEEFLGVIEFFSGEVREPDPDLLEMMATLGGQVGQFLERRRAEEQLRESERELADFFENATVGLHWVGPDGTILRANRAELALLGYDRGSTSAAGSPSSTPTRRSSATSCGVCKPGRRCKTTRPGCGARTGPSRTC